MDLTALLPTRWRPHAKTVVAAVGLILGAVIVAVPQVPTWLVLVTKVLTLLGVHTTPNEDLNGNGIPDHLEDDQEP